MMNAEDIFTVTGVNRYIVGYAQWVSLSPTVVEAYGLPWNDLLPVTLMQALRLIRAKDENWVCTCYSTELTN